MPDFSTGHNSSLTLNTRLLSALFFYFLKKPRDDFAYNYLLFFRKIVKLIDVYCVFLPYCFLFYFHVVRKLEKVRAWTPFLVSFFLVPYYKLFLNRASLLQISHVLTPRCTNLSVSLISSTFVSFFSITNLIFLTCFQLFSIGSSFRIYKIFYPKIFGRNLNYEISWFFFFF